MSEVVFDFSKNIGTIKPIHAVNNGPIRERSDQTRGNFAAYRAAKIPFARTHDAAYCSSYGGEHTVDISAVFPDFNADACAPSSYDFTLTDEYLKTILDAGTKIYYRLGSKIEHWNKKYGTLPPADYQKWAVVCEHIIMHYNEGWANGYHWDIEYWEIWNEPDIDADESDNKRCWGGSAQEFYELYEVAATHLKSRFPHLKIGGPALAWDTGAWTDNFLSFITRDGRKVPLDFFSWHQYTTFPRDITERAEVIRKKLDAHGYNETQSIQNEWNYVENWNTCFIASIEAIIGIKGAAFTLACMCESQNSSIDMLMYYDARPCAFNGLFDFYTMRPLKGYYPFVMFSELYALKRQICCKTDDPDVYVLAAGDEKSRAAIICSYTPEDGAQEKRITVRVNDSTERMSCRLLDGEHSLDESAPLVFLCGEAILTLKPNSAVLLKF